MRTPEERTREAAVTPANPEPPTLTGGDEAPAARPVAKIGSAMSAIVPTTTTTAVESGPRTRFPKTAVVRGSRTRVPKPVEASSPAKA
ncbi:hypothetical protein [Actinokineospora iranica]|uniref:Uncharacterized protein n=1 Tax=Actinokineospora iranica TaxID=1271860 RepID=A0A1G6JW19_9PSEU|nr:hypothetical protein [Actinokineospora iranica]SDC22907.1 hypothetical protein SAMN05216174_101588 [Actinokineospora iranica]